MSPEDSDLGLSRVCGPMIKLRPDHCCCYSRGLASYRDLEIFWLLGLGSDRPQAVCVASLNHVFNAI